MVFLPSMNQDSSDSFYVLVESLLSDIFKFASLVPRVAKHGGFSDYLSDVEDVSIGDFCIMPTAWLVTNCQQTRLLSCQI